MRKKRVGVLISGRGSNMVSLIRACQGEDYPASIDLVISNRPRAAGLELAREMGVKAIAIDHRQFDSRESFEDEMHRALLAHDIELICNAGFMRLLTESFVEKWRGRQLNIHPSLLPAFKGLHIHERVLKAGVRISGCTVHFVSPAMDAGPVIAQAAVPVMPDDNPDSLAARVLRAEHRLYPHALELVASGKSRMVGEKAEIDTSPASGRKESSDDDCFIFSPPLNRQ